ncbi:unnamed protein product [Ixodes pacificus]
MLSTYQSCFSSQISYNDIVVLAYLKAEKLFFNAAKHRCHMWWRCEYVCLFRRCVDNKIPFQ